MIELFRQPRVDFMGQRRIWLTLSGALILASVVVLAVRGLNLGIEFTGGTELQVRYTSRPDLGAIRSALSAAGMSSQVVTTIGDPAENEVYIRLGTAEGEEDPTSAALAALRGQRRGADVNLDDADTLTELLRGAPGLAGEPRQLAQAILEARRERAYFASLDDLAGIPGMSPESLQWLRQHASAGPLALRSQSYIGPAVGRELVRKAVLAILGSLAGMLVYIWIRFQFQFGLAAVVAVMHDTVITLGLFSLFGLELELPVIAAFLTLIGYSVNDTVVIFDRIRENLGGAQRSRDLAALMNESINQTLSRTVLTSGLTWLSVLALFLLGGEALRPFSFVLTVGIIVGSYSTIFIASPFLLLWRAWRERRRGQAGQEPASAAPRRARKVRSSG